MIFIFSLFTFQISLFRAVLSRYTISKTRFFLSGGRVPWLKCAQTDSQKDTPYSFSELLLYESTTSGLYCEKYIWNCHSSKTKVLYHQYALSVWKASILKHWENRCKAYLDLIILMNLKGD